MKENARLLSIREVCFRCGRFFLIHDDTVWTGNNTYHYECWMKEKREEATK